jgi:DNA-binding GntR family transcriptional regulator
MRWLRAICWLALAACAQSKQLHAVAASRNHAQFAAVAKEEAVLEVLGHTYYCMQAVQLTCRSSCIATE